MGRLSGPAPELRSTERYEIVETVGSGGMAVVCRARDLVTGKELGIKRMRPAGNDPQRAAKVRMLFEREYYTLSQLAHPRVVEVFDYGVDALGPYYTMELLDGGDLAALAPAPWKQVCGWVRDICSVLSLLHSRQFVHRDVSARNIRCTRDGLAKLIDFGAMAPMGPAKEVVGTPAVCPPEVLHLEQLDARADLYALGCTFYFALTGTHAYPASRLAELPQLWSQAPLPPSRRVEDVPPELDSLVMAMVQPDRSRRPASAAEVMEQVSLVAKLPHDEQLPVSHAYLSTPALVGRNQLLPGMRKRIARCAAGRGGGTVLVGDSGQGRSRLLDEALLEAKLAGALTLRADWGSDSHGELGGVLSLGRQLLQLRPEPARRAAEPHRTVLGHLFPELLETGEKAELATFSSASQRRARLQSALQGWLTAYSAHEALVLSFDDVDTLDEFSTALAALLVSESTQHRILVLATIERQADREAQGPLQVLCGASTRMELRSLHSREVTTLLRSVFGDVHHVQNLAHQLHRRTRGNPRDVMTLARHLVERGVVTYESGSWVVPERLDEADLPESMAEALRLKVGELSEDALSLARAVALSSDVPANDAALRLMAEHRDPARLLGAVNDLLAHRVLRAVGEHFELAQPAWEGELLRGVSESELQTLHVRLVERFESDGDDFRAGRSALHAGQIDRGLDLLVTHAERTQRETDRDPGRYLQLMQELPATWLETYQHAFEHCRRRRRGTRELYALCRRASGLIAGGSSDSSAITSQLAQLVEATGLDLFPTVDGSLPYPERIKRTFELAHQRYSSKPERDRILPPTEALRPLAGAYIAAIGTAASQLDVELWESMPSLAPFAPLSPGLAVIEQLVEGVACRITGRTADAVTKYEAVLDRLDQPDRAGLDETYHRYTVDGVACGLGLLEAPLGSARVLQWVDRIDEGSMYAINAQLVRMVYCLWQGNREAAERHRREAERLRIRYGSAEGYQVGGHLLGEVIAYAATDDVIPLKQVLVTLERLAASMPRWRPVLHFARGEYHRMRGKAEVALADLERACDQVQAGRHQLYCEIQGARVRLLCKLRRFADARSAGRRALEAATRAELGYSTHFVRMPLAMAHAALGEHDDARELAEQVAEGLEAIEAGPLLRGMAEETRARVAIHARDQEALSTHLLACADLYTSHGHRALRAKYERLSEAAERAGLRTPGRAVFSDRAPRAPEVELSTMLSECRGPDERAHRALELMLESSGSSCGALFAVDQSGPTTVAEVCNEETADLTPFSEVARAVLLKEVDDVTETGTGDDGEEALALAPGMPDAGELHSVLIAHTANGCFHVTGVAILRVAPGGQFVSPTDLAIQLSRYWHELGEARSLRTCTQWWR